MGPAGEGTLTHSATMPGANIGATSTAVMYRPGMILQVGGGAFSYGDDRPASNEATIIDISSGSPVVTAGAPRATRTRSTEPPSRRSCETPTPAPGAPWPPN